MARWDCDFDNCDRPSVRTYGECVLCNRHLCAKHLDSQYHTCPTWEDEENYFPAAGRAEQEEITRLLDKINIPALVSRASSLRKGMACSIPHDLQHDSSTRSSVMGGMNYHIEIQFEDGISWLARIRRLNAASPPRELRQYLMRSEVATLQFLSRTNVPVPKVFDFNSDEANPVGAGYILMEKLPGAPLDWSSANADQKRKVIDQLADIYIVLQDFPFATMGSLNQPGTDHIGPFARDSLVDFRDSQMKAIGPCSATKEFYVANIELTLDLIMRQESYTNRPVDAFLIHRYLLDTVPKIFATNDIDDGKFYLKHADDKGDHILVDDDYNITGIIDWEWAYTDSKSAAFNSPIALLPVADFYGGVNHVSEDEVTFAKLLEEKGHRDLGSIVRNGRLLHRFQFCCGYDIDDWEGFLGLFFGLLRALGDDGDLSWETWRTKALELYRDDSRLQHLINM